MAKNRLPSLVLISYATVSESLGGPGKAISRLSRLLREDPESDFGDVYVICPGTCYAVQSGMSPTHLMYLYRRLIAKLLDYTRRVLSRVLSYVFGKQVAGAVNLMLLSLEPVLVLVWIIVVSRKRGIWVVNPQDPFTGYLCALIRKLYLDPIKILLSLHSKGSWVIHEWARIPDVRSLDRAESTMYGIERSAILQADALSFPCKAIISQFEEDFRASLSPSLGERVFVIYNGVNPQALRTEAFCSSGAKAAEPSGQYLKILSVGAFIPQKGHDTLIEALSIITSRGIRFQCSIVGGYGHLLEEIRAKVRSNGLLDDVSIIRSLPRQQLLQLFASSDLFVVCSRQTVFDNTLLEAMSFGLPIVTTSVGGNPEMLEHGRSALLVPPNDPSAVAEAICQIVQSPKLKEALSKAAMARVEQYFNESAVLSGHKRRWRSLAQGR